jgi:uncharacterized protein (DUF4213/DUF364 family)
VSTHTQHDTGASSVIDMLIDSLMNRARRRTVRQAILGSRFCGITLDDGATGVANLCPEVCGQPSRPISDCLPRPGSPAADVLATLAPPTRSAVGLATASALANRPEQWDERREAGAAKGDLLEVLELRPDDQVGMVGCFAPLVEPIGRRVQRLFIFERGPRLTSDLLPESQAGELLPQCSIAIITATTLLNGTIDALLAATPNCREVVVLGPSTPLVPAVFVEVPRRVSLLAGVLVTDANELLRAVARGGGTRDFLNSVAKVNVRVRDVHEGLRRP